MDTIDYGPLTPLIGTWTGDKGMDVAPEPDGPENTPYYETITFDAIGDVTNAGKQTLAVLYYRQIVTRKEDNAVFHDECGYWTWDAATGTVTHSLSIPRAVTLLAGGEYKGETTADGRTVLDVAANLGDEHWGIVQSPFMRKNATTTAFSHHIEVGDGKLSYHETTTLDIYGKIFEHTDGNELTRVE